MSSLDARDRETRYGLVQILEEAAEDVILKRFHSVSPTTAFRKVST